VFIGQTQEVARGTWRISDKADNKDYLEDQCQNPFDLDDEASTSLINITKASKEVEMSTSKIPNKGKEMLEKFATERLVKKTSSFWDSIPNMPLVTFSAVKKCLSMDKDRKLLIDTEVLFGRHLAVSKNRDVDMQNVLAYELAAVPQSMFHDDGTTRKTKRLIWPRGWRNNVTSCLSYRVSLVFSQHAAYLIDGMAMIQPLNDKHFKTFNDLGKVSCCRVNSTLEDYGEKSDLCGS